MGRRRLVVAAVASVSVMVGTAHPAAGHVTTAAGPLQVAIGWEKEPAYAGFDNSVQLQVTDEAGAPVADIGSSLMVELSFNDQRVVLPLLPNGRPGEVEAVVIPTKPGIYSLHASGKVRDQAIDITTTCGDSTFACVADAADVQFPVKQPSVGQFAQRIDREAARAANAESDASSARLVAVVAVVVALAALAFATALAVRGRRARTGSDEPQAS